MRQSASGLCAKVKDIWDDGIGAQRILIDFDDSRVKTEDTISFTLSREAFFPFRKGDEIVLTIRRLEK